VPVAGDYDRLNRQSLEGSKGAGSHSRAFVMQARLELSAPLIA